MAQVQTRKSQLFFENPPSLAIKYSQVLLKRFKNFFAISFFSNSSIKSFLHLNRHKWIIYWHCWRLKSVTADFSALVRCECNSEKNKKQFFLLRKLSPGVRKLGFSDLVELFFSSLRSILHQLSRTFIFYFTINSRMHVCSSTHRPSSFLSVAVPLCIQHLPWWARGVFPVVRYSISQQPTVKAEEDWNNKSVLQKQEWLLLPPSLAQYALTEPGEPRESEPGSSWILMLKF